VGRSSEGPGLTPTVAQGEEMVFAIKHGLVENENLQNMK